MEKVDKHKFMIEIWKRYNEISDMEFLAKACEVAPFLAKKKWQLKLPEF